APAEEWWAGTTQRRLEAHPLPRVHCGSRRPEPASCRLPPGWREGRTMDGLRASAGLLRRGRLRRRRQPQPHSGDPLAGGAAALSDVTRREPYGHLGPAELLEASPASRSLQTPRALASGPPPRLVEASAVLCSAQHLAAAPPSREAVLVRRQDHTYYQGLFSTADLDSMLRNEEAFSTTVWQFLAVLQEQFGSMAGSNVYLTPPNSQGFAPHYDDIEAFVLQLEGRKLWRVYRPRVPTEELALTSSPNFSQEDLGEPVLQTVLEPGDLLYFPRGFIHQAECQDGVHSLHLTVSTYQRNTWGDFLEAVLPLAVQAAMEENVEFRRGLPRDFMDYMGAQHSESKDPRRTAFMEKVRVLVARLGHFAPVDAVADQRAKDFIHDSLPPVLTDRERALSVYGLPIRWETGEPVNVGAQLTTETEVHMLQDGIARLVGEGGHLFLYYTVENSRVYHLEEPKCLEIYPQQADAMELLLRSYPEFVRVADLPCDSVEDQLSLATMLYDKGLLLTKMPLT
ncbi:hypothetical protein E2I00_007471, partial [Balaenoptera physalus]